MGVRRDPPPRPRAVLGLLLLAWGLRPVPARAADLTAEQAQAIIAADLAQPVFPADRAVANPLAAVGGTAEDAARLEAEAARWIPALGREAAMFHALTSSDDPHWQRLADRFQGIATLPTVRRLPPEAARALAGHLNILSLPGLEELGPDTAAALAMQANLHIRPPPDTPPAAFQPLTLGCRLTLLGVDDPSPELLEVVARSAGGLALADTVTLRPEAASVLAAHAAYVELPKLRALPLDLATALGSGRGDVTYLLNGLEQLTPEAAAALHRQRGVMTFLRGLRTLSPGAARPLVGMPIEIVLDGLESIDAATAAVLATHENAVYLPGLRRLDADVIRAFHAHPFLLQLGSREPLSPAAAAAVCGRQERTRLAIPPLDVATARILATGATTVDVETVFAAPPAVEVVDILATNPHIVFDRDQLTTLSVAAAAALARHENLPLSFARLTAITPEVATALATNNADPLLLGGLQTLPLDVATALARHPGELHLVGLQSLDHATAAALARHGGSLSLGLERLTPEVARGLARHAGPLLLDRLHTLDPQTAAALARGPEVLSFASLRTLDAAAARALADHDGMLRLDGLVSLPVEVAEPLLVDRPRATGGREPGLHVNLPLLSGLSPRVAAALVKRSAQSGEEFELAVKQLTSVEVARTLATTRHRIALPRLRQVTPAALVVIKSNPLVEIPATDALEFLTNPDGSADDFATP